MKTILFGFELEGFYKNKDGIITIPPKEYPTDGFPGLCEVRTVGGNEIDKAYFNLLSEYSNYMFDTQIHEHTFSPEDKVKLRTRNSHKAPMLISNIYGKKPRALGNRTLASFQINISSQKSSERQSYIDHNGQKWGARAAEYELFDFTPIVRALDEEFKQEIKNTDRQEGFYSIKDGIRLEYRSLPNTVFSQYIDEGKVLLSRINGAIQKGLG